MHYFIVWHALFSCEGLNSCSVRAANMVTGKNLLRHIFQFCQFFTISPFFLHLYLPRSSGTPAAAPGSTWRSGGSAMIKRLERCKNIYTLLFFAPLSFETATSPSAQSVFCAISFWQKPHCPIKSTNLGGRFSLFYLVRSPPSSLPSQPWVTTQVPDITTELQCLFSKT